MGRVVLLSLVQCARRPLHEAGQAFVGAAVPDGLRIALVARIAGDIRVGQRGQVQVD